MFFDNLTILSKINNTILKDSLKNKWYLKDLKNIDQESRSFLEEFGFEKTIKYPGNVYVYFFKRKYIPDLLDKTDGW